MGIENKILQPIRADNLKTHEQELGEKLELIQLVYADDQFRQQSEREDSANLAEERNLKFSDIIQAVTSIGRQIRHEFDHRTNHANIGADEFMDGIYAAFDRIYSAYPENWKEQMLKFVRTELEKLGMSSTEPEEGKKYAGMLNYSPKTHNYEFEKLGIGEDEDYIEIHFEEAYKQDKQAISITNVKESFAQLANIIVKQYPQARYVVAQSWILDNSLAKRLGFKIIERSAALTHQSTWWQFIDKGGQIDKHKLEKFLTTGELPYMVALGLIRIEDFLDRFLPADSRGEIVLQELSPDYLERKQSIEEFNRKFKAGFDQLTSAELIRLFHDYKFFAAKIAAGQLDQLFDFIREVKAQGYTYQEVGQKEAGRVKALAKEISTDFQVKDYVEKRIFLQAKNKV
jgi:hypothetical protein